MSVKLRAKCAGCKRKILDHEPDLVLRKLAEEDPTRVLLERRYHERCAGAAVDYVTERPALYRMTHRYVEVEAN